MYANVCPKCQTRHPLSIACPRPVDRPAPMPVTIQPTAEDPFRQSGQPARRPKYVPVANPTPLAERHLTDWRNPETSPLVNLMDEPTRQAFDAAPIANPSASSRSQRTVCKGCYLRDMKIRMIEAERDKLKAVVEQRRSSDRLRQRKLTVRRRVPKPADDAALPPDAAASPAPAAVPTPPPTPQGGAALTSPAPVTGGTIPSPPDMPSEGSPEISAEFFGVDLGDPSGDKTASFEVTVK